MLIYYILTFRCNSNSAIESVCIRLGVQLGGNLTIGNILAVFESISNYDKNHSDCSRELQVNEACNEWNWLPVITSHHLFPRANSTVVFHASLYSREGFVYLAFNWQLEVHTGTVHSCT